MRVPVAILAYLLLIGVAVAQITPPFSGVVVTACGTPPGPAYVAGTIRPLTQDTTGKLCLSGLAPQTGAVLIDNSPSVLLIDVGSKLLIQ